MYLKNKSVQKQEVYKPEVLLCTQRDLESYGIEINLMTFYTPC